MEKIKVMIVEDDFMAAGINKDATERAGGFAVTMIAKSGGEALEYLARDSVDLVILDVYLPDMLGLDLLKAIRKKEYAVDFILITAAHDAHTVEEATRFGIFDYLIKPCDFKRYAESLARYRRRRASLKAEASLDGRFGPNDVSSLLGVSRVTAHRYLEHLAETGLLDKDFRYTKIGRPAASSSMSA